MSGKQRIPETEMAAICVRYNNKEDVLAIAVSYGVQREAIYRILRRSGIRLEKRGGTPTISEEIRQNVVALYQSKVGATTIARRFDIDKKSVYNILFLARVGTRPLSNRTGDEYHFAPHQEKQLLKERLGHQRGPKGKFNKEAFSVLDEAACYWVGYLITDGCIGSYNGRSYRLYLPQARKHREQCEGLKAYLQSELGIQDYKAITFGKLREFSRVSFTLPTEVAKRLLELGIRPAKTAKAQASECLLSNIHFWRGVIDGDGSCYIDQLSMNSSSTKLASQYRRFLMSSFGVQRDEIHIYRNQAGVWSVRVWGYIGSGVTGALFRTASEGCRLEEKYQRAMVYTKKQPPA